MKSKKQRWATSSKDEVTKSNNDTSNHIHTIRHNVQRNTACTHKTPEAAVRATKPERMFGERPRWQDLPEACSPLRPRKLGLFFMWVGNGRRQV